MGDSKEKISYKLAEEARGKLIDAAKSCYAADYNSQLNTPEDITKNKIHSTITAATIVAMVREVKQDNGIKTIPIILTVSTEHQKETVREAFQSKKQPNLGIGPKWTGPPPPLEGLGLF